jgi:hypothetical protein
VAGGVVVSARHVSTLVVTPTVVPAVVPALVVPYGVHAVVVTGVVTGGVHAVVVTGVVIRGVHAVVVTDVVTRTVVGGRPLDRAAGDGGVRRDLVGDQAQRDERENGQGGGVLELQHEIFPSWTAGRPGVMCSTVGPSGEGVVSVR